MIVFRIIAAGIILRRHIRERLAYWRIPR